MQDLIAEYQGGEFQLFFANCQPLSAVSFELRTELYNVKSNGKRDYLSIGEDELPTVFMVRARLLPSVFPRKHSDGVPARVFEAGVCPLGRQP